MIRQTLAATQAATFSIDIPNEAFAGMPTPAGTGFFVAGSGWFVTAAHVVLQDQAPRPQVDQAWLMKETRMRPAITPGAMCQFVELNWWDATVDVALLKVDFDKNRPKEWLKDRDEFPFLRTSSRDLEEGEPVYAFGYPLPEARLVRDDEAMKVGHVEHRPRVTSAIVASTIEGSAMVMSDADPVRYVLDKALNYGNSGGPIVASETGRVHALCSRFQPAPIPQSHLRSNDGKPLSVQIPSLYGIVSSLSDPRVLQAFSDRGIPVSAD